MTKENLNPDMELKEAVKAPHAREVLLRYGFASCLKCGGIGKEKLIHAARCHGVDVEELIREILETSPRE